MTRARSKTRRSPAQKPFVDEVDRQILQLIPADPGWHALYERDGERATTPVVCFALVEFRESGTAPFRVVCPMVVHEDGAIEDVHYTEGFVRLLPPCMHGARQVHDEEGELPGADREVHS